MAWIALLAEQLHFYWTVHLRPRLDGLTDDEYLWEPGPGAWSLRPGDDGSWRLDGSPLEPPTPPVTTIAWRAVHIGRDVLGKRARAFFGAEVDGDLVMFDDRWWPEPLPATAPEALAFLDEAYGMWHAGVTSLDDAAAGRPLGPRGGPYATSSVAELVAHVNREVMAHGAEICLLRDLYRAERDAADPMVVAVMTGDEPRVRRLLADGVPVRPGLVAEAAGRGAWGIVRALVEAGGDVDDGGPTALHYAAGTGDGDAARWLLAQGADWHVRDPRLGLTPADWARHLGHHDLGAELESAVD